MRICLISREFPPDTGFGGIATFARHLALGLQDLGHTVEVISLAKGRTGVFHHDGVKVHRVEPFCFSNNLPTINLCMPYSHYVFGASTALWQKFVELHEADPFDVVDTPELLAEGLYPAVTRAVPLLIRLYTPHSKFIAEQLHGVTASFDHLLIANLERVSMQAADVLTSPSNDLADFVASDLNYPKDQINIVCNPIDTEEFRPEGQRALEPADGPVVLFVGRLEERKGITYLIETVPEVAAACPDVRFVVIGDDTSNAQGGQRSVLQELKESLNRSGCASHVTFIPRVPLVDLPAYYRSADVCVVPSVYDNSPYTCLEAMSCGRAVIGTSAGGTREYIVDGESGIIVPPRDTAALSQSLINLLTNQDLRTRLAENARVRVLEKFDRKQIALETAKLYELAIHRFHNGNRPIYGKDWRSATATAEDLLASLDQDLYTTLRRRFFDIQVRDWYRLITLRPGLSLVLLFLSIWNRVWSWLPPDSLPAPRLITWLQQEVQLKTAPSKGP
jgi:glycosyltransferase involved in cell wall biosynthesis